MKKIFLKNAEYDLSMHAERIAYELCDEQRETVATIHVLLNEGVTVDVQFMKYVPDFEISDYAFSNTLNLIASTLATAEKAVTEDDDISVVPSISEPVEIIRLY